MEFNNEKSHQADLDFVKSVMKAPSLEWEEEKKLALAWQQKRDAKSFQSLITSYTRLVVSMAIRFRHYGVPIADLIQEGTLGLIEAANRFDPLREVRFSTYAKLWVLAGIQDYIIRNWSIVRMGSTSAHRVLFFNLNRLRQQLGCMEKTYLLPQDCRLIAHKLHVTLQDVEHIEKRLGGQDVSLNASPQDDNLTLEERLADSGPSPETESIYSFDSKRCGEWLLNAMGCLNEREKHIVENRRLRDPSETLENIGKDLGLTKERVRQLEVKALRKMRFRLMSHASEVRQFLS
jgi:RNA polymerase sigma-32 factor